MDRTLFQVFDNITFSELWETADDFVASYNITGLPKEPYIDDETLKLVWLLLIGRFADSTIKPYNTYGAFKVRFMSKVWQYTPTWKKRLDIQNKLRALSLEDGSPIFEGSKAIYNSAMNPGTQPSTGDSEELNFINNQNTTKYKKSKLEGFAVLNELLENDVTEEFLRRFDSMFKTIIFSGRPLLYQDYLEGDEE
jgi:hypothetical protein